MRGTTQSEQIARIKNTVYPDAAQHDINHLLRCLRAEKMQWTDNHERYVFFGAVVGAILTFIVFMTGFALT